jgi:hypothetical protein
MGRLKCPAIPILEYLIEQYLVTLTDKEET